MGDAWDRAMQGLSELELRLIMRGAVNGTLRAAGAPENAFGAGLKAAMELNRRAASVDGRPKAGDALAAPLATSAVPKADAQTTPPFPQSESRK